MRLEHILPAVILVALGAVEACKGSGGAPGSAPSAQASAAAAAEAPPAKAEERLLRCGDFLSRADVSALGLGADSYSEDDTQGGPGLSVLCKLGGVLASINHGGTYDSMSGGAEEAIKRGTIAKASGPAVGSASMWTTMGPMSTLAFRSTSQKYAATLSGRDKALVEKVGRALDAKMN